MEEDEQPRNPCGAKCCKAEPNDWTKTSTPRKHEIEPEVAAKMDAASIAKFEADCAATDRATAFHEAAHCLIAAVEHQKINHVQGAIDGTPHISYEGRCGESNAMINFAGPIGTGIARGRIPYSNPGEARLFITKARGEDLGDCDRCNAARTLLRYNPEASDDELIEKWRERWEMAVEILDTPTARCTLGRLASALQEKKHLSSDEVHQVIGDATDTIDWAYIFEKQSK